MAQQASSCYSDQPNEKASLTYNLMRMMMTTMSMMITMIIKNLLGLPYDADGFNCLLFSQLYIPEFGTDLLKKLFHNVTMFSNISKLFHNCTLPSNVYQLIQHFTMFSNVSKLFHCTMLSNVYQLFQHFTMLSKFQ